MVIDFHTHIFPDKIAERAVLKLKQASHTKAFLNGTESALTQSMKKANIDMSVVLQVATNPAKVQHINELSAEKNGKNGLIYFGCIHPSCENIKEEIRRIKDLGLVGIKLHPIYQDVDFDDRKNLEILYCAEENGLITVTHAGDDVGFPGVFRCTPRMMQNAVNTIKPKKLVLAHMGGWRCWQEACDALSGSGVFIDTSFSLGKMVQEEEYYSETELSMLSDTEFCEIIKAYGTDKVLFGTDSPWSDQKDYLEAIRRLPLSDNEKNMIFYENALNILNYGNTLLDKC